MSYRAQDECEKRFINLIQSMAGAYQTWQIWGDLITAVACTISNTVDMEHREKREEEYLRISKKHDPKKLAEAFSIIVEALDDDPNQDFLGRMYMGLNLGSHWHGQFFTPYNLCEMSAKMQVDSLVNAVSERGWASACDPAVGGGAMLIAAANTARLEGVNYQQHILFAGQDVDRVAGMMAYIQLSLLGCPGYVCIADTLSNPMVGDTLFPAEKEYQEYWYTPMFFSEVWHMRRLCRKMDLYNRKTMTVAVPVKEEQGFTLFFNFDEEVEHA